MAIYLMILLTKFQAEWITFGRTKTIAKSYLAVMYSTQ